MTNEIPEVPGTIPPPLPAAGAVPVADPPRVETFKAEPSGAASAPAVGYCRACGVSLTAATVRQAMGTLYCAEHVPAAAAGAQSAPAPDSPYASAYAMPPQPPVVNADVNPGLAFLLGLMPGVGAIYNGQYAKGLVHVIVFGFFISLADADTPLSPLAGLLIPVWVFYMAFEAYHTAKLRHTGQPVDEFSSIVPADKRSAAFPMVPVFLIGAGIVFLLINFEILSFRYLMRLWPAGLIVLGLYLLWDRVSGGRPSTGGFGDVQ